MSLPDRTDAPTTVVQRISDSGVSSSARSTIPRDRRAPGQAGAPMGRLGRYNLLEEVGRGGMGRVLKAYDPQLQREVAIKELRRDRLRDTDTVARARVVAEARAMARLAHPNVVAVFDVQELLELTIVMEFVDGVTLRQWVSRVNPSPDDVLQVYVRAGRGLAAAHAAGLLHRDFKPHNVLVAPLTVSPTTVKVTDFGLAKPRDASETGERSTSGGTSTAGSSSQSLTGTGTVMGTPRYMAPEQHAATELTPAADQYAFCVALWEALCGAPPFSGRELHRAKLEGPPAWPSDAPPMPRHITEAIRRGMSPRSRERWPDMDALLDRLTLDPRRRRRIAALSALGGAAVAGLLAAASYGDARCSQSQRLLDTVWDPNRRAEVQASLGAVPAPFAEAVRERSVEALDEYAAQWVQMHQEACEATSVRGEQSQATLDLRMACLRRARDGLGAAVDVLADADVEVAEHSHAMLQQLHPLQRCADVDALREDVAPPLPREVSTVAAARAIVEEADALAYAGRYTASRAKVDEARYLAAGVEYAPVHCEIDIAEGRALARIGDYDGAEQALRRAFERATAHRDRRNLRRSASQLVYVIGSLQRRPDDALRYLELGEELAAGDPEASIVFDGRRAALAHNDGRYPEAEKLFRRAIAAKTEQRGAQHLSVAQSRRSLAVTLIEMGRYDDAEQHSRAAITAFEQQLGPQHPLVADARTSLANLLDVQARFDESAAEHRKVLESRRATLGDEHPDVGTSLSNLANAVMSQGNLQEAAALQEEGLRIRIAALGEDHPVVAESLQNLANVRSRQGRNDDANDALQRALVILEGALEPGHPRIAALRINLANIAFFQKRYADAEQAYRQAADELESSVGPAHTNVALARNNLAATLRRQGKFDEAEALLKDALAVRIASLGEVHPDVAQSRGNLALVYESRGDLRAAEEQLRLSLAILDETLGDQHAESAKVARALANNLLEQGRAAAAHELARRAWSVARGDEIQPRQRGSTAFILAQTTWATTPSARDEARRLAQVSIDAYLAAGDTFEFQANDVRAWLAKHRR